MQLRYFAFYNENVCVLRTLLPTVSIDPMKKLCCLKRFLALMYALKVATAVTRLFCSVAKISCSFVELNRPLTTASE